MRGDVDTVVAASTYVEAHGFAPFDAFVPSNPMAIRSCPHNAYEGFAPRFDLKDEAEARDGTAGSPRRAPLTGRRTPRVVLSGDPGFHRA
jgi:hypothetical protein